MQNPTIKAVYWCIGTIAYWRPRRHRERRNSPEIRVLGPLRSMLRGLCLWDRPRVRSARKGRAARRCNAADALMRAVGG